MLNCDVGSGCDFVADGIQAGDFVRIGGLSFTVFAVTSVQIDLGTENNAAVRERFTGLTLVEAVLEHWAYGYAWEVTFTQQAGD